jgi:DNA-binding transcriptional LysR family regulator
VNVRQPQLETPDAYAGRLAGDTDIAVTYQYPQFPHASPDGITVREISEAPFFAAVTSDHPLARCRRITLREANDAGLIATPMT